MCKLFFTLAILIGFFFAIAPARAEERDVSPDWVAALPQARNATQLFVVAGIEGTTAWASMHEKDADGAWRVVMTTPGFIGWNGMGKMTAGDGKTPVGTFRFDVAFGIAPNPGCKLPYTQVDENIYWSGDGRPGMMYNRMVDIRKLPAFDTEASEHLIDYDPHYTYAMNITYNADGIPGRGAAIFLHCFGPAHPYTAGCVAIPMHMMRVVMQNVRPDCVVVIDSLENLSPETFADWEL